MRDRKMLVYLFTGFTQGSGRVTGMEKVYNALDAFRSPGMHVEIKPWWTDHKALAKFISRQVAGSAPYRIVIAGYSYGGDRSVRLCRELDTLGVQVRRLYLIDAVWRPSYPLPFTKHLPSILSMARFPKLMVPSNVAILKAWRQSYGPFAEFPCNPRGHDVDRDDRGRTEFDGMKTVALPHSQCDDSSHIRQTIVSGVQSTLHGLIHP